MELLLKAKLKREIDDFIIQFKEKPQPLLKIVIFKYIKWQRYFQCCEIPESEWDSILDTNSFNKEISYLLQGIKNEVAKNA